ncbi:mandelate racemase/muconate lactonizing enzyme family protein [Jiangella asiatica]|uniref:Mandelate racemase/muconate lactonizing enzyme C-terminal domain-containing protein n=1 Tax=Jiangella asiatica TaxID=2530372 RepID=A0A4R5D8P6_9ACTN|nr:mandelate racemase/muconate lactonizing enzyme family protein [Jiangella asiatica]TDE09866.1 hypothetical protein E1269_12885 [Jiangella asiatica]
MDGADPDARLAELTWLTVTIGLPRPLRVGSLVIDARQYCCVRATLAGGAVGEAFVMTRGLDVAGTLSTVLAPQLSRLPTGGGDDEAALRVLLRNSGWDGPISRAAAAVFLAALDARARGRGVPAWQLVGSPAGGPPPRIVAAIGYTPVGVDPAEAELAEAAAAVEAGADAVKLMGGFGPPWVDLDRLRRVRAAVGDGCAVALDVNGNWSRDAAVELLPRLSDLGVDFVEEPWPFELGLAGPWANGTAPALAVGEVVASTVELEALAATGQVRYLRPDVTVLGGPGRFLAVLPAVWAAGSELMPHFWPEVHRHLIRAYPGPSWVEATVAGSGGFALDSFVDGALDVGPELAATPTRPGFGYTLDWDRLRATADGPATTVTLTQAAGS